jgi:hypothetical protein
MLWDIYFTKNHIFNIETQLKKSANKNSNEIIFVVNTELLKGDMKNYFINTDAKKWSYTNRCFFGV